MGIGTSGEARISVNHVLNERLREAVRQINRDGTPGKGACKEAEFNAKAYVRPGYYPHEACYYVGGDVPVDRYVHSLSLSVNYQLARVGLLTNSFYVDRFNGYHEDDDPIVHDYVFHVVGAEWLPEEYQQ